MPAHVGVGRTFFDTRHWASPLGWAGCVFHEGGQGGQSITWRVGRAFDVRVGRAFLDIRNWASPFQGLKQTLLMRVLSTSIYFPLEDGLARPLGLSARRVLSTPCAFSPPGSVRPSHRE